jgi:UDP-N-acetylglucosamine 2-epimerase (non-hydrolysing)
VGPATVARAMAGPKILCVVGTRPEAIKMAPVIHALRAGGGSEVSIVATAQHRGLLDVALADFDLTPDIDLDLMRDGQSLAELTSRLSHGLDAVFADQRPSCVVAQGDTTTTMVSALAAFHRGIPFAHVEAGLRTGDVQSPFPEEMNRQLCGRLATWHFAPTARAARALLAEGVSPCRVIRTGNTAIDALHYTLSRVPAVVPSTVPTVLLTAHRRESFGAPLVSICEAVRELVRVEDVRVLFPVHPNPAVRQLAETVLGSEPRVELMAPLDRGAFIAAMRDASLILTDSGGVQEEAPSLGTPVLVLREVTERPEAVDAGAAELVGTDPGQIVAAARRILARPTRGSSDLHPSPFGDGRAAQRITAVLLAALRGA